MYFGGLSSCNMFKILLVPINLSFPVQLLCSYFSFSLDTQNVLYTTKDLIWAHTAALSEECGLLSEHQPDMRHMVRELSLGFRLIMFPVPTNSSLIQSSIMFRALFYEHPSRLQT